MKKKKKIIEVKKDQEISENETEPVAPVYPQKVQSFCEKHKHVTNCLLNEGDEPFCELCNKEKLAEEVREYDELKRQELEKYSPSEAKARQKTRKLPINNLDSAWLSAEPDYSALQDKFKEKYAEIFEIFNSSIRLANIPPAKVKILEYDLVTAGYSLFLGYPNLALSVFYDICAVCEISHGVKGFRSNSMNKIIQEIHQKNSEVKSGLMGGKKDES